MLLRDYTHVAFLRGPNHVIACAAKSERKQTKMLIFIL
jgi:hypothetical protein